MNQKVLGSWAGVRRPFQPFLIPHRAPAWCLPNILVLSWLSNGGRRPMAYEFAVDPVCANASAEAQFVPGL